MTTKRRRARQRAAAPTRTRRRMARARKGLELEALPAGDIEALRAELERNLPPAGAARWNVDPEDVQRSVAKLVLTLMEFLRKLLERQAIRRMEARTLTRHLSSPSARVRSCGGPSESPSLAAFWSRRC
jgi:hypothetical protein